MLEVLLSFGGIEALIPLIIVVILIGAAAGLTRKFDFLSFLGISAFAGAGSGFAGRGSIKGKSAYGRLAGRMLADKAPVKAKALWGKQQKRMQTNSQMKQERMQGMNGAPGTAQAGGGGPKTPNTGKQLAQQKYGRVKMVLGYLPSVAGLSWMSGLAYGRKGQKYGRGRLVVKVKQTGGAVLTKEGQVRPGYGKFKDRIRNRGQPTPPPQAAGAAAPAFVEELSSEDKYANLGNGGGDSERKELLNRNAVRLWSLKEHENAVINKRIKKLKNYYDILNVKREATNAEIKGAYRQLVLKYHPDVNKSRDAETHFKEINEAYEVLVDKVARQTYDTKQRARDRRRREKENAREKQEGKQAK